MNRVCGSVQVFCREGGREGGTRQHVYAFPGWILTLLGKVAAGFHAGFFF